LGIGRVDFRGSHRPVTTHFCTETAIQFDYAERAGRSASSSPIPEA
jgi:hypothetical protein